MKDLILNITKNRNLHVPSFFIMSFYFMSHNLIASNIKNFLKRLLRLLLPYIIWPIVILKTNGILNTICKKKLFPDSYQILKLQLLWGSRYMAQFWFQWNLIIITILFFIVIIIAGNHTLFFMQMILILSYVSQYSGYYYNNFYLKYPEYNKYTITRLFEMIPFGVVGFTFGFYKVINIFKNNKIKTLIYSLIIYNLISYYNIFSRIRGLTYQGIKLNILSNCTISIFSVFPSDKIKSRFLLKLLIIFTNYTAGVFYLHRSLHNYLKLYFVTFKNGEFISLFFVYACCYFICLLGTIIFGKTPFKYLFC